VSWGVFGLMGKIRMWIFLKDEIMGKRVKGLVFWKREND
jgi:hypothetical protein